MDIINKTKKVRILHVIGSSDIGGAENVFLQIAKYLNKEKFDIFIACPDSGLMVDEFRKHVVELRVFNFENWFFNPKTISLLVSYIKEKQIQIVHTHLYNADFMGIIAAKRVSVLSIATIHGHNFSPIGQRRFRKLKNYIFSFFYRCIYSFCDSVVCVCKELKKDLIKRPGIAVKEKKIAIIYNSVDTDKISHADSSKSFEKIGIRQPENYIFVGVIANFDRVKGHHVLLKVIPRIAREYKNVKFLCLGAGEEKVKIQADSMRKGLSEFIVFLEVDKDPYGLLNFCKFIVVPSLHEGFPLVVLEAMFLKKAVIATNVGGIPEVVVNEKTGLLVAPNNFEELTNAIFRLLSEPEFALRLGLNGYDKVKEFHQPQRMVNEYEKVYLSLLEQGSQS